MATQILMSSGNMLHLFVYLLSVSSDSLDKELLCWWVLLLLLLLFAAAAAAAIAVAVAVAVAVVFCFCIRLEYYNFEWPHMYM